MKLKNLFCNSLSTIKSRFSNDKIGMIILVLSYFFIGCTLLTLPIFTHQVGYTVITNILSIISGIFIFSYLFLRGKFRFNYYSFFVLMFAFYSIFITLLTTRDWIFAQTVFTTSILAIVVFMFFAETKQYKILFFLLFGGFFIYSLYFLGYYLPDIIRNISYIGRLGDKFGNLNGVGTTFSFGIIFCLGIIAFYKKRSYFLLIPTVIFTFCMICTGSRGAFINTIIALIVFLYLMIGRESILSFFLTLVICVCGVILILQIPAFNSFKTRLTELFITLFTSSEQSYSASKTDMSIIVRFNMLINGIKLWSKNIFFGFGISGFRDNTVYPYYSHSTISELLADTGLLGSLFFTLPFIKSSYYNFKNLKKNEFYPFFVIVLCTTIALLFSDIIFYSKICILVWAFIGAYTFSLTSEKQIYFSLSFFENKKFKFKFDSHLPVENNETQEKTKPEILFVLTSITGGGAEKVATILCSEWAKNYNVTLVLTSVEKDSNANYPISKSVELIYLSKYKKISLFSKITVLRDIMKKKKSNICVTFLANSFLISKLASRGLNLKHIFSIRIDPTTKSKNRILKKFAYKYSNAIVCQTNEINSYFINKKYDKSLVITNPSSGDIKIQCDNNKNNFIAIGRLTAQKNFIYMINAFSIFVMDHPDVNLTIYGSGEEKEKLNTRIRELHLERFIKIKSFDAQIMNEISSYGIYLSSSLFEGLSNSMIEASLAGLPILSLDCKGGSAKEIIINEKNGIIVPLNEDYKFFARKLSEIYDKYDSYRKNSIAHADIIAEKTNATTVAKEWIELFDYFLS